MVSKRKQEILDWINEHYPIPMDFLKEKLKLGTYISTLIKELENEKQIIVVPFREGKSNRKMIFSKRFNPEEIQAIMSDLSTFFENQSFENQSFENQNFENQKMKIENKKSEYSKKSSNIPQLQGINEKTKNLQKSNDEQLNQLMKQSNMLKEKFNNQNQLLLALQQRIDDFNNFPLTKEHPDSNEIINYSIIGNINKLSTIELMVLYKAITGKSIRETQRKMKNKVKKAFDNLMKEHQERNNQ